MTTKVRGRLGQRREFQILLPLALLILICLSTFTLFAYRSSIDFLYQEKERELTRLARTISSSVARGALPTVHALRLQLPSGVQATIFAEDGSLLVTTSENLPTVDGEIGPDRSGWISVRTPIEERDRTLMLKLEQPSRVVKSRETLRILVPVVLVINALVVLLVLLYFRYFLAPFDRLVERAQQARPESPQTSDEVAFLVETFDRALEALARPPGDEDLMALQRTLAPSLESGVLLCDRHTTVIAVNEVGATLLGIDRPAAGTPLEEALEAHPDLQQRLAEAMRALRGERRTECEIEVAGQRRTLGFTVHVLRRDDGEMRGFLVLFIDLTAIHRQSDEKRLAETLAELGEIAAGVAHELRNSVATLNGYLTLVDRGGDSETIADFTSEIRRETEHLRRVVDDFLAFARPGTARTETVALADLARRTAADPALGEAEIQLRLEEPGDDYAVHGDPQLLERALRNLVRNAVQAMRRQGVEPAVEVTLRRRDETIEIRVDDRGTGIAPEIRERLFHPFASGRPGGVGLGLALSLRIVHLHGGDLSLDDRPGGGARAVLSLPAEPR